MDLIFVQHRRDNSTTSWDGLKVVARLWNLRNWNYHRWYWSIPLW